MQAFSFVFVIKHILYKMLRSFSKGSRIFMVYTITCGICQRVIKVIRLENTKIIYNHLIQNRQNYTSHGRFGLNLPRDPLIQPYSGHDSRQSLEMYSKLSLGDCQPEYEKRIKEFPI